MGEEFTALLLIVFATHLPLFAWRWRRTGERRHAATTLTFGLLVVTYALRVFAPGLEVEGHERAREDDGLAAMDDERR